MTFTPLIGPKIRDRRRALGITQSKLAATLAISSSYLNLIEAGKRNIGGSLLKRIAEALGLAVDELDGAAERRLLGDLRELTAEPLLGALRLDAASATDLAGRHPGWARALVALHRAWLDRGRAVGALTDRLHQDPFLADAVHNLLTRATAIRSSAEILESAQDLVPDPHRRFVSIVGDESRRLADVAQALAGFFAPARAGTRSGTPADEVEDFLFDHGNYFPALEQPGASVDGPLAAEVQASPLLTSDAARRGARRALERYFAAAALMPYEPFLAAARRLRYDVDALAREFQASVEQVSHRLATLRRPGAEGLPFGLMRIDGAGFTSARVPLPRLPLPRHGGACPLWAVYLALQSPGAIVRQLVEFPDGERFLFVARTFEERAPAFPMPRRIESLMLACDAIAADQTVYADGLDLTSAAPAVPVGANCRVCVRADCAYRQEDAVIGA
jgi:predicted transcriptional regulator/transcriptional regulator with XRE-family HTH domain